jgi:hypothetical protein
MVDENPLKTVLFKPKEEHVKHHEKAKYEGLPNHPFALGIIGSSGTGKTNLVLNVLLRWYNGYFHKVYVCSASWHTDDAWSICHSRIPDSQVVTDINEVDTFVENIYQEQAEAENNKNRRILIIFDDFGVNTKKIKSLNSLARSRHSNASVIVISQRLMSWVPPGARTNFGYLALFPVANGYERKTIASEYAKVLDNSEFLALYDMVCVNPGDFLWLNLKGTNDSYYKANLYTPIKVSRTK